MACSISMMEKVAVPLLLFYLIWLMLFRILGLMATKNVNALKPTTRIMKDFDDLFNHPKRSFVLKIIVLIHMIFTCLMVEFYDSEHFEGYRPWAELTIFVILVYLWDELDEEKRFISTTPVQALEDDTATKILHTETQDVLSKPSTWKKPIIIRSILVTLSIHIVCYLSAT
ncbi:hypothetical protein ACFX2I_036056 [Malus domestica]